MNESCADGELALHMTSGEIAVSVKDFFTACSVCSDSYMRTVMNTAFRSIRVISDNSERLRAYLGWACGACILKVKPAALLRVSCTALNLLDAWNKDGEALCADLGLRALMVCNGSNGKLLLIYNERLLSRHLKKRVHADFLAARGYPLVDSGGSNACIQHLAERFSLFRAQKEASCFPHEVGVFLGYPLADVITFIKNKTASCPCVGYWKAWTRPEKALRSFRYIDRARLVIFANACT